MMKRTKKLSQPAHHAEDLVKAIGTSDSGGVVGGLAVLQKKIPSGSRTRLKTLSTFSLSVLKTRRRAQKIKSNL